MTDRNVQYPYRFHVRPVPGTDDICEIIPAPGTVYEDGTFWNKQNVLQDITAALYDKGPDATPDDIFAVIGSDFTFVKSLLNGKGNVSTGSFSGTGTTEQKILTFPFQPKIIFLSEYHPTITSLNVSQQLTLLVCLHPYPGISIYGTSRGVSEHFLSDVSWGSNNVAITTYWQSAGNWHYIAIG